jgi:hypothetical protein
MEKVTKLTLQENNDFHFFVKISAIVVRHVAG